MSKDREVSPQQQPIGLLVVLAMGTGMSAQTWVPWVRDAFQGLGLALYSSVDGVFSIAKEGAASQTVVTILGLALAANLFLVLWRFLKVRFF